MKITFWGRHCNSEGIECSQAPRVDLGLTLNNFANSIGFTDFDLPKIVSLDAPSKMSSAQILK